MGSLQEIVYNSIMYQNAAGSLQGFLVSFLTSVLCGVIIYGVYRYFNRGIMYNANFNLLIFMICIVTSFVIYNIGANIVLSLGMVGALSIVRFRAAVKDPLDVGFLFWGAAAGLSCGAQIYTIAIAGTVLISVAYIIISLIRTEKRGFMLMLRYAPENENAVKELLSGINYTLKNKTQTANWIEFIAEVKVKDNNVDFLQPIMVSEYAINVSVTEYTGD